MSEPQSQSQLLPPPPPRGISGRIVMLAGFVGLVVLMLFMYYVVPTFVTPYFADKPNQTKKLFSMLETAVLQYAADNDGALPPEDEMLHYRRLNKNILRSRAAGMTTISIPTITSPVSYLDPMLVGDPYAVPEQYTPPAYIIAEFKDGGRAAVFASPGPNLIYDVRPWMMDEVSTMENLRRVLAAQSYDPTNGTNSAGDYVQVVELP